MIASNLFAQLLGALAAMAVGMVFYFWEQRNGLPLGELTEFLLGMAFCGQAVAGFYALRSSQGCGFSCAGFALFFVLFMVVAGKLDLRNSWAVAAFAEILLMPVLLFLAGLAGKPESSKPQKEEL